MSSDINRIKDFLGKRRSYLKCGNQRISDALDVEYGTNLRFALQDIKKVKKQLKKSLMTSKKKVVNSMSQDSEMKRQLQEMASKLGMKIVDNNHALKSIDPKKLNLGRDLSSITAYKKGNKDNILVIGDLHEPFCLDEYLFFCREQQEIHDCGTVIFIGDVIDNHYSSYHEQDPDGYAAGEELDRAVDRISDWYTIFPKATVIIGNHDRMAYRKATTAGLSRKWVRAYSDVLNTPGWNFVENIELFGINFNHGEGGTARTRIKNELQSQVQGHLHSQFYVEFIAGMNFLIFGMQVGCGVDREAYAMAYGRNYKKPIIGCGVVLNKGTFPIPLPMKMK
jgi:predicted phosphodiesterase